MIINKVLSMLSLVLLAQVWLASAVEFGLSSALIEGVDGRQKFGELDAALTAASVVAASGASGPVLAMVSAAINRTTTANVTATTDGNTVKQREPTKQEAGDSNNVAAATVAAAPVAVPKANANATGAALGATATTDGNPGKAVEPTKEEAGDSNGDVGVPQPGPAVAVAPSKPPAGPPLPPSPPKSDEDKQDGGNDSKDKAGASGAGTSLLSSTSPTPPPPSPPPSPPSSPPPSPPPPPPVTETPATPEQILEDCVAPKEREKLGLAQCPAIDRAKSTEWVNIGVDIFYVCAEGKCDDGISKIQETLSEQEAVLNKLYNPIEIGFTINRNVQPKEVPRKDLPQRISDRELFYNNYLRTWPLPQNRVSVFIRDFSADREAGK